MRILHAANFNLKKDGRDYFLTAHKLSAGWTRLGHAVYDFSDRDVARAATPFGAKALGVRRMNRRFLDTVDNMRPDLVALGQKCMVAPATLKEMRRLHPAVRVLQWNHDPLFDAPNVEALKAKLELADATFVTSAGPELQALARPGRAVAFMPNPQDRSVEQGRSFAAESHAADLIYTVGTAGFTRQVGGEMRDVRQFCQDLRKRLPELRCRFPGLPGEPMLSGAAYHAALAESRMGLSLSRRSDHHLYSSDRMAHLMGNGVLTFIDRRTGFADIFTEREAAFYGSVEELETKLRTFHADEPARRAVAEAGWAKAHWMFDGTIVARYLLEVAFGLPLSGDYAWPLHQY